MRRVRGLDPLWRKTPVVLLGLPKLLASIGVGAMLLAAAWAGYPLIVSARGARLIDAEIADPAVTRFGAGITYYGVASRLPYGGANDPQAAVDALAPAFAAATETPVLGPAVREELGPELAVAGPTGTSVGRVFFGDGVLENVAITGGRPHAGGVWLADLTARTIGAEPGDRVSIGGGRHEMSFPVAGVYRALANRPRTGYWQPWVTQIDPSCPDCDVPAPFIVVDRATLERAADSLGWSSVAFAFTAPVTPDPTVDDARTVARVFDRVETRSGDSAELPCCRPTVTPSAMVRPELTSRMPGLVDKLDRDVAGIQGPGRVLQTTALLVACVIVAGAGAFGQVSRRTEAQLSFARGEPPWRVAARSAGETAPAALVGGAAGFAIALGGLTLVGGGRPSSDAIAASLTDAIAAIAVAIALVAVASAVWFVRNLEETSGRAGWLASVPWEIALGAAAAYAGVRLANGGAFRQSSPTATPAPTPLLLVFPLLAIAAVGLLAARAFRAAIARAGAGSVASAPWWYLAVRRLGSAGRATVAFTAAAAVCFGMFAEASTIVRSVRTTIDAKAELFVGSDAAGQVSYTSPAQRAPGVPITRVTKLSAAGVTVPGGTQFDLLAIDPRTFASAAYWRPGLSDVPLDRITRSLGAASTGAIPVVVAGSDETPSAITVQDHDVPVRVVATAEAFPGIASGRPLVVADADRLVEAFPDVPNPLTVAGASTELWARGPDAAAALRGLRYPPDPVFTARAAEDVPHIAIVVDTFAVLDVVGLAALILVVAAVLMYLQSRQRSRIVSIALSRRMGLDATAERRAILVEIVSMLAVALVVGSASALATAVLIVPLLDPVASIPPAPFLELPLAPIGVALVGVVVASWLGAWTVEAATRNVPLSEVMRGVD